VVEASWTSESNKTVPIQPSSLLIFFKTKDVKDKKMDKIRKDWVILAE
jgi:hypothetical protein